MQRDNWEGHCRWSYRLRRPRRKAQRMDEWPYRQCSLWFFAVLNKEGGGGVVYVALVDGVWVGAYEWGCSAEVTRRYCCKPPKLHSPSWRSVSTSKRHHHRRPSSGQTRGPSGLGGKIRDSPMCRVAPSSHHHQLMLIHYHHYCLLADVRFL